MFYLFSLLDVDLQTYIKEANPKITAMITIKTLQKELYQFLIAKGKPYLSLPHILRKQSNLRAIVTIRFLLPLMSQTIIENKPKELVVELITDILEHSQSSIQATLNLFKPNQGQRQQQLQIINEVSLVNILSKAISLPSHLLNLISDAKINIITISTSKLEQYKYFLYNAILAALQLLPVEQRIVVINRLLILKQEQAVLRYFIKKDYQFIVGNFNTLSKQSNIIKNLYKRYIVQYQNEERFIIKQILIEIANKYQNSTPFFMSLLNFNESFYYSGQKYKQFYYLLLPTNQIQPIARQLLQWWAISKQFILPSLQARVRCNLLAMIIQNLTKEDLYSKNYLISITQGIKKRLTDGSSKNFASLIWKILGKKIELQLTQEIEGVTYFQIEEEYKEKQIKVQKKLPLARQPKPIPVNKQDSSQDQKPSKQQKKDDQQTDMIQIEPKNIYDCILGLKNPHRKQKSLKKLSQLIKKHKQDLILMWNTLLRQLLCPLKQQYIPILVELLSYRPQSFIESVGLLFMNKQANISQKTYLMEIIKLGIEELSTTQESQEEEDQPFYFKKLKSTYYKQSQKDKYQQESVKKQPKTRRWGHARIAHQNANNKNASINFIKKQQSINRFYPVANLLYFKIIDVFTLNPIDNLRSHQVYIHSLLRLLAVFVSNIKNHMDKYIILLDVSFLCTRIIEELIDNLRNSSDRYEQTGGLTLMLTLQILNKISLIIDQFIPQNVMKHLKTSIQGSKKLPNYGMSSVLDMIESNIYQRLYTNYTSNSA